MEMPEALSTALATLSQNLEPSGDDLEAMLSVLLDDLSAAVPSFIGLSIQVRVGLTSLVFSTLGPGQRASVAASLSMPAAGVESSTRITFYASGQRAFTALAADAQNWTEFTGSFDLDIDQVDHLPDPIDCLRDFGIVNQALGALMGPGLSMDKARDELEQRAATSGRTIVAMAEVILAQIETTNP